MPLIRLGKREQVFKLNVGAALICSTLTFAKLLDFKDCLNKVLPENGASLVLRHIG